MESYSDTICFHFDTIENQFNSSAFNQMVNSINIVTNNVSQVFLGEKAKCQIYILPIENGSFKSKFKITVKYSTVVTVVALGLLSKTNFFDGFGLVLFFETLFLKIKHIIFKTI